MKLFANVTGLKDINGKLVPVSKGQGSNQSLQIEIIAESLKGIPTRTNVYRLSLNVGNDNELQVELLDYSTGEKTELTKGEKQKGEIVYFCEACGHIENWNATLYSEKGEPVCPNCDTDMTLQ